MDQAASPSIYDGQKGRKYGLKGVIDGFTGVLDDSEYRYRSISGHRPSNRIISKINT